MPPVFKPQSNRTIIHTILVIKNVVTWRTVWRFLKKLKIKLLYDPAIPLLGMLVEKTLI